MKDDIRYIELIKACGLYGNDHLGDMLELCYQVAADEREACAQVCEDHFSSDGDWCAKQIRTRGLEYGKELAKREWVGLTTEDWDEINMQPVKLTAVLAAEAKLKEKNT